MVAKYFALLFCFALVQAGTVRRDAPATPDPLQDLVHHASEFQKTFSEQLNSLANSHNTQETTQALKDGFDTVLQRLSTLSNSIQGALTDANGKTKQALEQTRDNLERTVQELRQAHPEVEQHANALRDQIKTAVDSAAEQTKKLAQTVSENLQETNEKLAPKIRTAYDDFVKHAQEVQKKVQEAASRTQ